MTINWSGEHWFLLSGFLAAFGTQLAATGNWAEIKSPTFWAALAVQIALFIRAAHVNSESEQKAK